jgi:GWxTD domain-containing protein
MTMSPRFRVAFMLLVALSLLAAGPPDYKTPGKDWAKGPVKWIMTADEEKAWKGLRTDEERAAFAASFWQKRDPTPGTPENEYQVIFWKKVEEAEKAFKTQTTSYGSLTDRGRVYLLIGPPAKMDKDTRDHIIWIYEPNEVLGITARFELMFASGQQNPLLLDRKKLEEYVASHPETRGIGWKIPAPTIAEGVPDVPTAPARNPDEDLTPESKRQIPILEALLAKGSGPTGVPFEVVLDHYAAADGTTLTVVTVEAPREAAHGSGDAALHPFARLEPAGEGKPLNLTGDLPFVPAALNEAPPSSYTYQSRHNLQPGKYRLAVVVEDKVVPGQMGTLVKTIDVPDFRGKELNLSSVSLLSGFARLDPNPGPDDKARSGPYVLGSFRLVPRASLALQKSESVTFYYQVYNPATDPAGGRPSLESTVTFYVKDGAGWKRYRPPVVRNLGGQVDLYAIDLKDLLSPTQPLPADFKMEMKLVDKIAGKEQNRELLFTVR